MQARRGHDHNATTTIALIAAAQIHKDRSLLATQLGWCPPIHPRVPSHSCLPTGHSLGGSLSKADSSTPPLPRKVLGILHGTYPRFHLGVAVHPVHNRFTVSIDFESRALPASCIPSSRGGRSLGVPLNAVFLRHHLFHRFAQTANNVFPARFELCHKLDPIFSLASPPCNRCVPLCSSVMDPNFVLPPLNVAGSHAIYQDDRLLHHAVVLQPKLERRTCITERSPSHTAHVIVVHVLLAIFSVGDGKPTFFQLFRRDRDFLSFVGHPSFVQPQSWSEG